ncbi:hypothetical protein D5086_017435 [Populus alba]|uniref:Uncharacterized protein n=1 Tax=Populus alba TaxID=43335 RepID=A0ACC4BWR6_POPAL
MLPRFHPPLPATIHPPYITKACLGLNSHILLQLMLGFRQERHNWWSSPLAVPKSNLLLTFRTLISKCPGREPPLLGPQPQLRDIGFAPHLLFPLSLYPGHFSFPCRSHSGITCDWSSPVCQPLIPSIARELLCSSASRFSTLYRFHIKICTEDPMRLRKAATAEVIHRNSVSKIARGSKRSFGFFLGLCWLGKAIVGHYLVLLCGPSLVARTVIAALAKDILDLASFAVSFALVSGFCLDCSSVFCALVLPHYAGSWATDGIMGSDFVNKILFLARDLKEDLLTIMHTNLPFLRACGQILLASTAVCPSLFRFTSAR